MVGYNFDCCVTLEKNSCKNITRIPISWVSVCASGEVTTHKRS